MLKGFEEGAGNKRLSFGKVSLTAVWRKERRKLRQEVAAEVVLLRGHATLIHGSDSDSASLQSTSLPCQAWQNKALHLGPSLAPSKTGLTETLLFKLRKVKRPLLGRNSISQTEELKNSFRRKLQLFVWGGSPELQAV